MEQGTDSRPVPGQHQPLPARIPQGDGELTVEILHEAVAMAVVQVDDDLGVRPGVEHVAGGLEFRAQLDVVEDLAVEYRPHIAVRVVDRLISGGQIDDRQSGMREPHARLCMEAITVRPTVREGVDHAGQ